MIEIKETAEFKAGFDRGYTAGYSYGMSGRDFPADFAATCERELTAAEGTDQYPYILGVTEGIPVGYNGDQ